ncbi:MAG TPA: ABC transporter permease [Acidimicrobiales bacterium]|nr:ABC transporter permease [Acidimicrobiales bacterium]
MTALQERTEARALSGDGGFPLASKGLAHELRAVSIVLRREAIRFSADPLRVVVGILQPILFLFVLGSGLGTLVHFHGNVNLRTFLFPGAAAMSVLFTALFSAGSIVWDREFGFLREMLVAPVSRTSLVVGKCLGGALVSSVQGVLMICISGLAGVPYNPVLMLTMLGELLLLALTVTAFGMVVAARIRQFQSFMAVTQMLVMPLFFLSGAMYPLTGLPAWLRFLTRIDPLTYAVDPIRKAVFEHLNRVPPSVIAKLVPGVTWDGWHVPLGLEIAVVAVMALAFVIVAALEFRRTD